MYVQMRLIGNIIHKKIKLVHHWIDSFSAYSFSFQFLEDFKAFYHPERKVSIIILTSTEPGLSGNLGRMRNIIL